MQPTTSAASEPMPVPPIPDFINGRHTKLRPVLEANLSGMARLMAEAPRGFSFEREPWTLQRLRKKFADEKEPGLWSRRAHYFAVTDNAGELVGVLHEQIVSHGISETELHIAEARSDRNELGTDALAAYVAYKSSWQVTPRIETMLLETQTAEREWVLACGFEHEMRCAEGWLYRGQLIAFDMYAWIPQWVLDNRAPDGIGQ